jgi:hypothetical protein
MKKPNAEERVVALSGTELEDLLKRKLNGRQVSCLLESESMPFC